MKTKAFVTMEDCTQKEVEVIYDQVIPEIITNSCNSGDLVPDYKPSYEDAYFEVINIINPEIQDLINADFEGYAEEILLQL